MKIKVDTLELKDLLNKISKLKIDSMDLISITVDGFKHALFKACNYCDRLEMSITLLKVQAIEDGTALIPYYLLEMLAQQNTKVVTISTKELSWSNGNIEILQEQEDNNFKTLNIKDGDELFFIYEEELYRVLKNVSYSAAKDNTRPVLKGVNFKGNKIVAIDGYVMAIAESDGVDIKTPITLTQDLTKLLLRILDKKSKRIVHFVLDKTGKYVKIKIGFEIITSKIIENEYVKYEDILPEDFNYRFTIENPKELLSKLKSMYGLAYGYHKLLRIKLTDDQLQIQDRNKMAIINSSVRITNVDSNKPLPFEIAVNPYYLYKPLNKYKGSITVKFTTPISPIVITDEDKNLDLVLPVRMADMEEGDLND